MKLIDLFEYKLPKFEQDLNSLRSKIVKKGINIELSPLDSGDIFLSAIWARTRNIGLGTWAMKVLTKYADLTDRQIFLEPSTELGGSSISRLIDFYKRFGFIKSKNLPYGATMYRPSNSKT